MPRLFFISVLLVGVAGCSSQHAFNGNLYGAAAIAGTESFYAFASEQVTVNNIIREKRTLVRFEPDGSSRLIREIDTSLWMVDQLARDTALVVKRQKEKTRYLFSVASGELSVLPESYSYYFNWRKMSEKTSDSLKKESILQNVRVSQIYPLYAQDCYLLATGYGSMTCFVEGIGSGDTYRTFAPETNLMIVDMRKKTLTKDVGERVFCFSSSQKNMLVWYYEDGNMYSRIVKLEDVLE